MDVDFCKQKGIQGLSLNFDLFLEFFFTGAKVSSKNSNFSKKVLYNTSRFILDASNTLSLSTEK